MGKHERGYERQERDYYPTPAWVTRALLRVLDVRGLTIWEPAAGSGAMARELRAAGAEVFCSDIAGMGIPGCAVHDFTSRLKLDCEAPPFDAIVTNPPFGARGILARRFIEAGLRHLAPGGVLALLLPADYDSAGGRRHLFGGCEHYAAKLVLTQRIVWFARSDGVREAPKENHAWCIWQRSSLRLSRSPVVLYAGGDKPGKHEVVHRDTGDGDALHVRASSLI
jgi:SAM-dependent methyltransferase